MPIPTRHLASRCRCTAAIQGLLFIRPIIGSLSYTTPSLGLIVQPPGHRSRARPWCRRGRALRCSRRRHTVVLSSGVACSAHGEQRGGSVRRLRTRRGDELARSPAMPRPPPSMMPSLRRPCGRPSCSRAAISRLAAAGRPENHQGTQISRARPSFDIGSSQLRSRDRAWRNRPGGAQRSRSRAPPLARDLCSPSRRDPSRSQ